MTGPRARGRAQAKGMSGRTTGLGGLGAARLSLALLLLAAAGLWIATAPTAGESTATRGDALDSVGGHEQSLGPEAGPDPSIERLIEQEQYIEAFTKAVGNVREFDETLGPDSPRTLDELEKVGVIAHLAGDQHLAEIVLDASLARRKAVYGEGSPEVAETLVHKGLVARHIGRYEEARQLQDQALDRLEPLRATHGPLLAEAIQAQASWLRHVDLDQAIDGYAKALTLRLESPGATGISIADNLVWLGWTAFQAGRYQEATVYLAEGERRLREAGLPDHTLMGVLLSLRADELAINGKWVAAAREYEASTAIFERARRKHFPGFPRRESPPHGYIPYALTQLMQGRDEAAWDLLERARGAVTSDFLLMARWPHLRPDTYGEVSRLRREALDAEKSLRERGGGSGAITEAVPGALQRLLELRVRILHLEQAFLGAYRRDGSPSLAALQTALGPSEAYVGWVDFRLGNHHGRSVGASLAEIWAYVIRREGIRWIPLTAARTTESARSLDDRMTNYAYALQVAAGWPERVERDDELDRTRRELGATLVDPILPALDGIKVLIVEMSSVVPEIPLEALKLADGSVVMEHFAISYSPSAESYLALRSADTEGGDPRLRPALVVGDPSFDPGGALPPLPFSSREIGAVSSLLPAATVLRGAEASETRLDELARSGRLRDFGILHFATHILSGRHREHSALVLSAEGEKGPDGRVDAEEILADWQLSADLVALSGCHSMVGRGTEDRGEYLGFTQVLLAAGARSVLASMWRVDDEATALLMKRFYENLTGRRVAGPASKAEALREAGLWLRRYVDEKGRRPFEHPVYWSGFILIGPPDSPR